MALSCHNCAHSVWGQVESTQSCGTGGESWRFFTGITRLLKESLSRGAVNLIDLQGLRGYSSFLK